MRCFWLNSSLVGKQIKDSELINSKFNTDYVNLSTSTKIDSIGSISVWKLVKYFIIIVKTLLKTILDTIYIHYNFLTYIYKQIQNF